MSYSKQSPADSRSFTTSAAPGNRVAVHTPLGTRMAENADDVRRVANGVLDEMTKKLGRHPTKMEAQLGPKPVDDRSLEQKQARSEFKVVLKTKDHPMQSLADSLRGDSDGEDYSNLPLKERLARDAERIVERDAGNAADAKVEADRMARLKPQIDKLDVMIESEKWSGAGSQLMLDRLEMAREQLLAKDGCPEALAARMAGLKIMLDERAAQQRAPSEPRSNLSRPNWQR